MTRHFLMAAALSTTLALPAAAQTNPWSLAFNAGADLPLWGDVHGAGTGRVLNLSTTVESRTYDDIYGKPFTWSVDLGYLATPTGEVRARFSRTNGKADRIQVGDVAALALFAEFEEYVAVGVDFGYRQYLAGDTSPVRPFVGGSVGFVRVDEINATFTVPAASVVLANVPMYSSSTVPALAVSTGAQFAVGARFGLQVGVDFRWQGDLEPVDGLAGTGLEPINDESRRWSMPITAGAVVRF
jgi:hypothetical protein